MDLMSDHHQRLSSMILRLSLLAYTCATLVVLNDELSLCWLYFDLNSHDIVIRNIEQLETENCLRTICLSLRIHVLRMPKIVEP